MPPCWVPQWWAIPYSYLHNREGEWEKHHLAGCAADSPSEKLSVITLYKYTTWGTGFHSKASRFASNSTSRKGTQESPNAPSVTLVTMTAEAQWPTETVPASQATSRWPPGWPGQGHPPKNLKGVSSFRGPGTEDSINFPGSSQVSLCFVTKMGIFFL